MPHLMLFRQRAHKLLIIGPAGDGHGDDDVALIAGGGIIQHLQVEGAPHGEVLEVVQSQAGGQVVPDEKPGVLRVVDIGARQAAAELIGGLGFARAEGAVEPDNHEARPSLTGF